MKSTNVSNNSGTAPLLSESDDDKCLAESLQTIDRLTNIFGFDLELAKQAVDTITHKSDIQAACEWILDHGGEDKGGPIYPSNDCPHIENHVKVDLPSLKLDNCCRFYDKPHELNFLKSKGTTKSVRDYSDQENGEYNCSSKENWICLECNEVRCSRYVNGHSLAHLESTKDDDKDGVGHCIAVSTCDLSAWCHACGTYVIHPRLEEIIDRLQFLKFGEVTLEISS